MQTNQRVLRVGLQNRPVLDGDEQLQYPATLRRLQQRCHTGVPLRHLPEALRPHDTAVEGERGVV